MAQETDKSQTVKAPLEKGGYVPTSSGSGTKPPSGSGVPDKTEPEKR